MKWSLKRHRIDPVCGKRIKPLKMDIAAIHAGHSYYFCSPQCWTAFQQAPARYAANRPPYPKGWWQRYLQRIEKTTQGTPPCCR